MRTTRFRRTYVLCRKFSSAASSRSISSENRKHVRSDLVCVCVMQKWSQTHLLLITQIYARLCERWWGKYRERTKSICFAASRSSRSSLILFCPAVMMLTLLLLMMLIMLEVCVCVCVLHRRTRTQEKERIVISAEPFRAFYAHLNQYSILACFMWRGPPNMHTCIPIRHQSQSLTDGRSLTDTHN